MQNGRAIENVPHYIRCSLNDVVLYPTYNQPENDKLAKEVLCEAFPTYEVVGIDCRALIKQHGSLHCVTMQYPTGVIK